METNSPAQSKSHLETTHLGDTRYSDSWQLTQLL